MGYHTPFISPKGKDGGIDIIAYQDALGINKPRIKVQTSRVAADFLLSPLVQRNIDRLLLEGGPGQGKSTISQSVCQIHRIRLLGKKIDLQLMPDKFKDVPYHDQDRIYIEVILLNDAVEMNINEVLPRRGFPMSEQHFFDMF